MFLEILAGVLGTTAIGVASGAAYHAILNGWQHLEKVRTEIAQQKHERKQLSLALQTSELNIARQLWNLERDKIDRAKILTDSTRYIMLDSKTVLDVERAIVMSLTGGVLNISPVVTAAELQRRQIEAMSGLAAPSQKAAIENESSQNGELPAKVSATWALQELGKPSFSNLALGVAMQNGQPQLVTGNMEKWVHFGIGGSSGYGKSVFARWIAYQLALSGDVDLCFVDLENVTFSLFSECSNLLYPLADSENDALSIFDALLGEMERRKELYNQYPGVDSLTTYNAISGDNLRPVVTFIDEITALLSDKTLEKSLKTLALRARKFGLWLIGAGQDWRNSSFDISIRNQMSCRLSFKTLSKSQSHVLIGTPAAYDLPADKPGRCVAVLPGKPTMTLQTPLISRDDILAAMTGNGPKFAMPEPEPDPQVELIRELVEQGLSDTAIAEQVYGYKNSRTVDLVRQIRDNGTSDK